MDVRYKPEEWQDMKEGIDKITKEAIPKLKEMNRTLEDVEAKIRELDSDRSINFSHTNQEKKLHDLLDDYIELGNYCTKVGEVVSRHFDKPFLEDMDAFAGKIRDLSIKNYKTDNRIGATTTTTIPSAHGYGQVQTITTKKDEITVDDIFKESVAFEKVLKAQYKEIKKQNPDAELSYEQYRDFVPSMRGFEYETIAEGQKKLESWRDLAITGALIILTIAVPPVGITASVAYGGLQLKSAIEGKDWGTGRELTAAERAENGVFGVIDAIPVIGVAGKAFRATESLVTLNKLSKIKDVPGVKFTANKVSDVVQLLQNNKNTWLRDLKLKGLKAADKINDWDHAIKGGAAKIIDGTTGGLHIAKDFVSVKSLVPADGAMQLRRGTDLESRVKASHAESKADIQSRISKLEQEGRLGAKGTGNSSKIVNEANLNNIDEFINGTKKFDDVINDYVKLYSEKIISNKTWSWNKSLHGGANLTARQKRMIKEKAVADGLVPDVKVIKADGMRYGFADFKSAGLVVETKQLPERLWLMSDEEQFKWLDNAIGGRPEGMTWHHTEVPGKMELVPFGIHNITIHNGGRSAGMWADAPR